MIIARFATLLSSTFAFDVIQHAGPNVKRYSTGTPMIAASVHFAHRSRRFTIRTVSQTQMAAKTTPNIAMAVSMPGSYPPWRKGAKATWPDWDLLSHPGSGRLVRWPIRSRALSLADLQFGGHSGFRIIAAVTAMLVVIVEAIDIAPVPLLSKKPMSPDERTEQPEDSAKLLEDLIQAVGKLVEKYRTDKNPPDSDEFEKPELFEVMSIGEMRKKYYSHGEKPPPIRLDPERVPPALRQLIPLAEKWGISDDMFRGDAVANAAPDEIAALKKVVVENDDLFDEWLAGPESAGPDFSPEYIAFSSMRMAADGF